MKNLIEKLKNEPVRVRLYTLAAVVIGYLKLKGYLSPEDAEFAYVVAGIILAVEATRSKVTPQAKVDAKDAKAELDALAPVDQPFAVADELPAQH